MRHSPKQNPNKENLSTTSIELINSYTVLKRKRTHSHFVIRFDFGQWPLKRLNSDFVLTNRNQPINQKKTGNFSIRNVFIHASTQRVLALQIVALIQDSFRRWSRLFAMCIIVESNNYIDRMASYQAGDVQMKRKIIVCFCSSLFRANVVFSLFKLLSFVEMYIAHCFGNWLISFIVHVCVCA